MRRIVGVRGVVRRHRVTIASWTALATMSAALVAYAVNADGYPVHKAELNDGGIWITNQSMGAVGRQNVPLAQIDGRVFDGAQFTAAPELDVLQDGSAVISVDRAASTLMPVDVAMSRGLDDQKVTAGGSATLFGGGSLGVLDPGTGKLWATTVDSTTGAVSLADVSSSAKPITTVGGEAVGAATAGGTVYVASVDSGELVSLRPVAEGVGFEKPVSTELGVKPAGALAAMTAVGDAPVAVDEKGNLFALGAGAGELGNVGDGARLQQGGPPVDEVLIATPDSLLAVAVQGGAKRKVADVGAQSSVAAPVNLGNGCAFAAWASGDVGTLVTACDEENAETKNFGIQDGAELVFRVNRNQVVLNDQRSGMAWTVSASEPDEISDWEAFQPPTDDDDDSDARKTESEISQPPQATDDELGARDGRTTVLNVLDNDLIAAEGILSIVSVQGGDNDGVTIQIAPDRQSLLATVAEGASGTARFRYTIDDGTAKKASQDDGEVSLDVRRDAGIGKPEPRANPQIRDYFVAAGGVIEIAVAPDWRDPEYGDPIVVDSVKTSGHAEISTTALGLVRMAVPASSPGGTQTVSYAVSTGGASASGSVAVNVIPAGTRTEPPRAEPDVVSGEAGGAITVRPLDNDLPGADGSDAGAALALAGRIAPVGGLEVDTDLESGEATIKGTKPGTYFLDYRAGFGAAPRDDGQIRVDIGPPTPEGDKPVATPDVTAVHGISPITVDVLANDYDPRGRMLVVQRAEPSTPDSQLDVAVIDGRWIRVSAVDGAMTPTSQSVTYTISNGSSTASSSVNVTQREALVGPANAPITLTDRITVRAGDTASASVLDNDATPSGDPVGLLLDASVADSDLSLGELRVLPAVGKAYVAGRQVRFVAPESVDGPVDVDVQYLAENTGDPTAETAIGTLKVHITPPRSKTNPNLAPTPRALEGRVVQGDLLTLKLPSVGSDPDGDSVAVTGVATAPKLGRVLAVGASWLTYQAYPGAHGTDEFTYVVTDQFGEEATGQVRVGIVSAGAPQAPLAIDDTYLAEPGRTVNVDVTANDLHAPGTSLEILPLVGAPEGTELGSDNGLVSVRAPVDGENSQVVYTVTNGLAESRGVVTIKGRDGYNNPPVVADLYATPKAGASTVEVDVLAAVYDVDGPRDDLKLDAVQGVEAGGEGTPAKPAEGKVTVPVTGVAQVLSYRVLDGDGAAAAGAIYVPAEPTGVPYLKPGAEIQLDPGSTKQVDLAELVVDPEGDDVVVTTVDTLSASPMDRLTVEAPGKDSLAVTATASEGPGAIVFQVSDRSKLTDRKANTAYISVPVQVGERKPVIRCPSQPVEVPEGGVSRTIDISSVCHVWTADPRDRRGLEFSAQWEQALTGVTVSAGEEGVTLTAGGNARRGDVGALAISADGYESTGTLLVRVVGLPAPKLAPIKLETEAGKPVSVDVEKYLNSPLPADSQDAKVMAVTPVDGASAIPRFKGSMLTFTPKPDTAGIMRFRIEVSDVGGSTTSARPRAVGDVAVAVVARPDAPRNLVAGREMLASTVALTWQAPENNGLRVDGYEVAYSGSSNGTFLCSGSPCRITGLKNGNPYTFKVRARNATAYNGGWSEYSDAIQATPDAFTGPVNNLRVVLQRDNRVGIAWAPPAPCDCSEVQKYRISWPGGGVQDISSGARAFDVRPAPNGENITISVVPLNKKGVQENAGPVTTVAGMGAGKPSTPGAPNLAPTNRPGNASKAVSIAWASSAPNGPGPVSYQVQRSGGSGTSVVCPWTTATSCNDEVANDGTFYSYQVQAKNAEAESERERLAGGAGEHLTDWSASRQIEASAPPDAVVITSFQPTGVDGQATIQFNVGQSHGKANTVYCTVNGAPCGTWTGFATGGASGQSRTLTGLSDGNASNVSLRSCNGGTANLCGAPGSASTVSYGPIGNVAINATPDAGGPGQLTTTWSVNIDPNGKAVVWEVLRDGARIDGGTSGTGAFSRGGSETLPESTTYTYTVRINDTGGSSRAGKTATDTARTGTVSPTIWVHKGAACGPGAGTMCPGNPSPCPSICWFIVAQAANFAGTVTCRVYDVTSGPWGTWSQGNGSRSTPYWAGGSGRFFVQCDNGARSANFW